MNIFISMMVVFLFIQPFAPSYKCAEFWTLSGDCEGFSGLTVLVNCGWSAFLFTFLFMIRDHSFICKCMKCSLLFLLFCIKENSCWSLDGEDGDVPNLWRGNFLKYNKKLHGFTFS